MFSTNLREVMCRLCPLTKSDLNYYSAGLGLRTKSRDDYGDVILKYFNDYISSHPDCLLSGTHPKVETTDEGKLKNDGQVCTIHTHF